MWHIEGRGIIIRPIGGKWESWGRDRGWLEEEILLYCTVQWTVYLANKYSTRTGTFGKLEVLDAEKLLVWPFMVMNFWELNWISHLFCCFNIYVWEDSNTIRGTDQVLSQHCAEGVQRVRALRCPVEQVADGNGTACRHGIQHCGARRHDRGNRAVTNVTYSVSEFMNQQQWTKVVCGSAGSVIIWWNIFFHMTRGQPTTSSCSWYPCIIS